MSFFKKNEHRKTLNVNWFYRTRLVSPIWARRPDILKKDNL